MAIASLIISILAVIAAAGSTLYARRIWLIERKRDRARRQPCISAVYEDYGGGYPCLEITNDGDEDLTEVTIELREPLIGYVPAITSLSAEHEEPGMSVALGGLTAAETKRIRVYRDDPSTQHGDAVLYAHCSAVDGTKWRVSLTAVIPDS